MTDKATDPVEVDDSGIVEIMGYDKWPRDVSLEFDRALGLTVRKYLKNRKNLKNDFASVSAEFRAIETEFTVRLRDDDENVRQVRTIVTEFLLDAAWATNQPFQTCLQYWHDLQQFGFYCIEREGLQTGVFAALCLDYGQIDLGLSVVEPLIAKFERLRADPNLTDSAAEYYDEEIESFGKLRARLEAARG